MAWLTVKGTTTAHSKNVKRNVVIGSILVLIGVTAFVVTRTDTPTASTPVQLVTTITAQGVAPHDWQADAWVGYFSGDWQQKDPALLNDAQSVVDAEAGEVARGALLNRLWVDSKRDAAYNDYVTDPLAGELDTLGDRADRVYDNQCNDVNILASNTQPLPNPGGEVAKTVIIWEGDCVDGLTSEVLGDAKRDSGRRQRSYVYVQKTATGWQPVREGQLPNSGAGTWDSGEMVPGGMLARIQCGAPVDWLARLELVAALDVMCQDALQQGVAITVTRGWQSDQQVVGANSDELDYASVDGRCATAHCRGWAVDVAGEGVAEWLQTQLGCMDVAGNLTPGATPCGDKTVVTQAATYGFAQPLDSEYLEWVGAPAVIHWTANCQPPPSMTVNETIAVVWRCKLGEKGASRELIADAVSKALVVARCSSGLNAGLYQKTTQRVGAFALEQKLLQDLGQPPLPVNVASVAAELYMADRDRGGDGFSYWPCARVLPERGGPAVPAWAKRW